MASSAGLKVGIQGEAEFKRGIKDINGEMRNLRSELYATDKEFGKSDKSVEALTSRNKIYTKQVDEQRSKVTLLTNQHSKQKDELVKLEKTLEETNKAHGEGSKEVEKAKKAYDDQEKSVRKLESQLSIATSQLNGFEKQMKDNSKELALQSSEWTKLSDKIGETGTKIKTTSDTMQSIGGSMTTGITTPLTAMAGASVAAFNVVDEGMDTIVKKTGATGDAAKEFEQIYKDLGSSVPDSLNDVGAAIGEVNTRLGFTDDKLKNASETFLKFARINDIDVNSAIQLVTRAMGDAGIEADDYEKTLDQLTVAAQMSGISIDTLTGNLAKYGAPMRALGFDTETSIATFAGWEKAGVKNWPSTLEIAC